MTTYGAFDPGRPVLVLAHGAGAGQGHAWMRRVSQGLSDRGITVVTFDFPYMAAGKKLPDPAPVLERAYAAVWDAVTSQTGSVLRRYVGGKSMGGRIATQAAAKGLLTPPATGIVCFGYPLHPPGRPAQRRDAHLHTVAAPILFIHGTRDAFGTPDEMTTLAAVTLRATLHLVDGGDHSLIGSRRSEAGLERALDEAASWMTAPAD